MTYDPTRPTAYDATQREIDANADRAHDSIDTTADKAHQVADNLQNKAGDLKDKAQATADDVKDKAQQFGNQAADKADAATTTVGSKMTDVAQTIREKAPVDGPVADAADRTAETLERAGTYLQQQDISGMRSDLEGLIRKHPMESLLIGLGVGYLLARSTRR